MPKNAAGLFFPLETFRPFYLPFQHLGWVKPPPVSRKQHDKRAEAIVEVTLLSERGRKSVFRLRGLGLLHPSAFLSGAKSTWSLPNWTRNKTGWS